MNKSKQVFDDLQGEFVFIPNEFIEKSRNLSDCAKWLFVLCGTYTGAGKQIPPASILAQQTGSASPWQVANALQELIQHKWIDPSQIDEVQNEK